VSGGWTRGSAEAEVVSPTHRRLAIDSMGWVGSTKEGGEEATVIPININRLEDEMKDTTLWAGKVLMIVKKGPVPPPGIGGFATFGEFLKKAHAAHAVAIIG